MRYQIKRPGELDWEPFTTDSLDAAVESGHLRPNWKIRREGDLRTYSVDELCELESGRDAQGEWAQPDAYADERGGAQTTAPRRRLFTLLSFYLIATFLWRTLTPAHEFGSTRLVYLQMAFDVLCLVALIGLRRQMSRAARANGSIGPGRKLLFVLALIAALGLLAIRLNGNDSWWTGHLRFELPERR